MAELTDGAETDGTQTDGARDDGDGTVPAPAFEAPAIVYGPRWPVPFIPARDQVLATAARHPERVAVEDEGSSMTYAELASTSLAIGNWVRHRTAIDERALQIVAVVGGRSPALIPALLGVWRAGASYLPIDATYPLERIRLLLDDADPTALIIDGSTTAASLVAELREHENAAVLDDVIAAGAKHLDSGLDDFADVELAPSDLAYLIYTSGSTGKPKGAALTQHNVVNFLAAHVHDIGLSKHDRQGWAGNVSFDASVSDIWPPLSIGATLCVAPPRVNASVRALLGWLRDARITHTLIGTALINVLFGLEPGWWDELSLRCVITGGDRLTRRPPERLPFAFINAYGPTECTVWATLARPAPVARDDEPIAPTIGTPIGNAFIVLLDEDLHVCNVGEQGEICIGGDGVGIGYLGRPETTRDHFIDDAYSTSTGSGRLYRTGDEGILLPDGELEFVGRADRQIALRGFRIEAGEVEAGILATGLVKEAVVKRIDYEGLGPRVVAFLTWQDHVEAADVVDLRHQLQSMLPAYMVPNQFVVLDALPMTPNGKVDESKLAPPRRERGDAGALVAPVGDEEAALCRIFADTLGIDAVGTTDDYFALGGDSMSALEAMTVIEERFHVELKAAALQDHPTPRSFAALLDREDGEDGDGGDRGGDRGGGSEAWRADIVAEPVTITARAAAPGAPCVLVTGAHGFVGRNVARAVLRRGDDSTVIALTRTAEEGDALRSTLTADGFATDDRFEAVTGDLAHPRLGLDDATWDRLRGLVTAVIHTAAEVNHTKSYDALRAVNVLALTDVVQLAADAGGVPVITTSTGAVLSGAGNGVPGNEALGDEPPANGYAASKWAAERRLRALAGDVLPVRMVRLERVLPDDAGEDVNANDTITVLVEAAIGTGAVPAFTVHEPSTPVDVVGDVLADLATQPAAELTGVEVLHPPLTDLSWADVVSRLRSEHHLRAVGWDAWLDLLRHTDTVAARRALAVASLYDADAMVGEGADAVGADDRNGFSAAYIARVTAAMARRALRS